MLRTSRPLVIAASLVTLLGVCGAAPAHAAGATGIYKNCTAFNHHYPHGVGRTHAHDHTSGTPVTNFKHSTRLYRIAMNHNAGLDRDKDGVACEKA